MNKIRTFAKKQIEALRLSGKERTAEAYETAVKSLLTFTGKEISFEELTEELLKAYEVRLIEQGKAMNTISFYMRMLRAIYNRAHKMGRVDNYHTELFKSVFTANVKTPKRAVPPSIIQKLKDIKLSSRGLNFSRDVFLLSFYLRGVSFVDLTYLRKSDLRGNELQYHRHKTGQLITVEVEPCALHIIEKYFIFTRNSDYLLPIITRSNKPEREQYTSALRLHNKHLNKIGKMLRLDYKLTSYVARHSWATIAKNEGVPLPVISEGLGHNSERTTRIYLDSFDKEIMSKANRKVIASVTGGAHHS